MDLFRRIIDEIKHFAGRAAAGLKGGAPARERPRAARPDGQREHAATRARLGGERASAPAPRGEETAAGQDRSARAHPFYTIGRNRPQGQEGIGTDGDAGRTDIREGEGAAPQQEPGRPFPGPAYKLDRFVRRREPQGAPAGGEGTGPAGVKKRWGGIRSMFQKRRKPQNALLGVAFTSLQLFVLLAVLFAIAGAGTVIGIAKGYVDTTPVLDVGKIQDQDLTSFIYDGNGNLLTTFAGMQNRVWAPIDEIPKYLQDAIVAIEDARFLTHDGVDIKRIVGSFLSNMSSDSTQGGSTITQQLIKNTLVSSERTYKRKIQEAWLAMQLETQYSKPQILEAYLNTIPLGQSNYGVKAAAQDYFGKTLDQLTLRECAMLAGLSQSPYLYDPRRNTYVRNRMDITDKRTDTVLARMYENGFIDRQQYDAALSEKVAILEENKKTEMYDMPYFIEYAIEDITTHLLASRNLEDTGENRTKIDAELRTGGYRIYLSVDPDIQRTVEDTLYNWEKYPKMQISSDSSVTVRNGENGFMEIVQPQAAAVVLDYRTGQLKAIVGGRQQPTTKRTLNRAYQAHMPVGSSIKPIAVYGPALDMGASPATITYNVPAPITGWNTKKGYPSNYSGSSFTGPCTIRKGLINSYNVVAARVLMDFVGIENAYQYLQKLGVHSPVNKDGPGLSLGTSGITVVEMSAAFGAFGNAGEYIEPLSFTKILDAKGNTVLDAESIRRRTQAFKPSTAWMMVDMMKEAIQKGTGKNARIANMTVAGKTGTNSDHRGVSFSGITPYYAASIWVGSDAYKPLNKGATGGSDAAPLWKAFMQKIHADKQLENREIIDADPAGLGLVQATVCGVSGLLVTEDCALDAAGVQPVTDWFLEGTVPEKFCNMHYRMRICKVSGKLATEHCPIEEVEEKSVLLVPADSVIRTMKPEDVAKYFPNALLDFPGIDDITMLRPDNPDYAQYFCPVHTQEWADVQPMYAVLVGDANGLIADVNAKMDAYGVSQNVRDALNQRIAAVQDVIARGFSDPAVPPQTVYQSLAAAVEALRSYASMVLVAPTPSPTPSPTPTASPTEAG